MENTNKKCRAVTVKEFIRITDKCYKATMPDGEVILIPASQFCGYVCSETDCSLYLTDWICKVKKIKKEYSLLMSEPVLPEHIVEEVIIRHKPERLKPETGVTADESLIR